MTDFRFIGVISVSHNHLNNTVAGRKLKKIATASELTSFNFNSSVKAERSFAIRYPNVLIKSPYGNLDICLNCHANVYFQSRNSVRVILVADHDQVEMLFF